MDCDCAKGQFGRDPDFTSEVFLEDEPNERTYSTTRIAEMYIKY